VAVPDGHAPDHLTLERTAEAASAPAPAAPQSSAEKRAPHHRYLMEAAKNAHLYGFLALIRGAEARAPQLPRVGKSRMPSQNVADLAQAPTLAFPAPTVERVEAGPGGRARVRGLFLGLTGPMGPLPLHLTEYAFHERRTQPKQPFGRWLDVLTDRMLQFFYRAWADSQPTTHAERPADDAFARYLAALSGGAEDARDDEAFPARARLHYAGVFASRRSAAVLQDALSHLLRTPVRIKEYIVRWRDVEPADRTRLGETGGFNQLGGDAVLGGRVRIAEDTFRVVLRPQTYEEYEAFLPGGTRFAVASRALDALAPSHLTWELELEIDERQAPGARLDGRSRLGFTSWMAPAGRPVARADARLHRPKRTLQQATAA
jgi:type VI secretion system ImpH/TssG family protein